MKRQKNALRIAVISLFTFFFLFSTAGATPNEGATVVKTPQSNSLKEKNDGQTQISFVIPGQEWTIMYNMNRPGGPTGQDNPPQFNKKKIGASVTIGHTTYYPVVSDGYNSRQPNHPDNNRIVYYLREEGDQVYIRYSEAEEEQLLFDYNLEEGDYFFLKKFTEKRERIPVRLVKKDIVQMAGAMRRVYYFEYLYAEKHRDLNTLNYTDDFCWIEGLGTPWDFVSYDARKITGSYSPKCIYFTNAQGVKYGIFGHPSDSESSLKEGAALPTYEYPKNTHTTEASLSGNSDDTFLSIAVPKHKWSIKLPAGSELNVTDQDQYYTMKFEEPVVHDKEIYYVLESSIGRINEKGASQTVYFDVRDTEGKVLVYNFPISIIDYNKWVIGKYYPLHSEKAIRTKGKEGDIIYSTLKKITTEQIAGADRKCYYFEDIDASKTASQGDALRYYKWVEGIGTESGSIIFVRKNAEGMPAAQNVCFTESNDLSYPVFGGECGHADQAEWIDTPADLCKVILHNGVLQIIAGDNLPHSLKAFTLTGELLMNVSSFTDSYTASLPNAHTLLIVIDKAGRKVVAQ